MAPTDHGRRRALRWIGIAGVGCAGLAAARFVVPWAMRPSTAEELPRECLDLVERCFEGVDRALAWDAHAHVVGNEAGGHGAWVNPAMRSATHPWLRFQHDVYLSAAGVRSWRTADADYLDRLLTLQRAFNPAGRIVLLAFDFVVDTHGAEDRARSAFHVPDERVLRIAESHPEVAPGVSIHPYRADAAERVRNAANRGACLVKWLPNAQAIDPASPRCDPFYQAMADTGLPLLTHGGSEHAVRSGDHSGGNPLRLRRPLDHGVRVIVAHCAGTGAHPDLDVANERIRPDVPSFDLLLRLFGEPKYDGLLLADISGIVSVNRAGRPLRWALEAGKFHHRLLNGSDYPICAIGPMVWTWKLARAGLLDARDRHLVNRVLAWNPLLGDFVLKRLLGFPPIVFETARHLDGRATGRALQGLRPPI